MNRGQTFGGWFYLDEFITMFVTFGPVIGLGAKRKDWMLHAGDVAFRCRIENVTDEKVFWPPTVGQQW